MRKFIAGLVMGLIVATGGASFAVASHSHHARIVRMQARIQHKDVRIEHMRNQLAGIRGLESHYWATAKGDPSSLILYGEAAIDMHDVLVGAAH